MRKLLVRAAELALARPWLVVVLAVVPCLTLGVVAVRAQRDLTFTGVMDRSSPLVDAYFRMTERLNFAGRLPLLLEGDEEKLDDAARALVPALAELPAVETVIAELPSKWLEENAPWFVERALFDDWLGLALEPGDPAGARRLFDGLKALDDERVKATPKGARLVLVRLSGDPMSFEAGGGTFLEIERRTHEVLAPLGVRGTYAGLAAIAAQDQARTMTTVQVLSPVSLVLVLLLFRIVERRLVRLAAVATPMLLTVGATLGAVALLTGKLTIMETFFGVMVFGLGVDFALHLMVRLTDERARGLPYGEALRTTWWGTGPGVVSGGVTTAGAFFVCTIAPDPMAVHLGLSGGIGLGVCLALMLLLLPALWTLLERRAPLASAPPSMRMPLMEPLVRHAAKNPWLHVGVALVALAGALVGASRYRFETDLSKVFNRDVPALKAMDRLQELFGVNAAPYVLLARDLDEARAVSERMKGEPLFDRVDSAARFFPVDLEERGRLLEAARADVELRMTTYRALLPLMSESEVEQLKGVLKLLELLERARAAGPPTLESLPAALKEELLGPGGEIVVYAYVKAPNLDGLVAREERLAAQRVHPDFVGFGFLLEGLMAQERPWVVPVWLGILCFVTLVLVVDLRSARLVLIALMPVCFGTVVTFGALCWLGVHFNVITTLVVPLIIGLGVDDGIHVTHRIRERSGLPLPERVSSVGRAIVLTTATTVVSFVTLLFTNHAGMEGMALVMLIGLPVCLLTSITLVPALAVLLGVAQGERAG